MDQRGGAPRWWHAGHDWETTEAEVDLRVGGVVRVVMRDPNKDAEYGGGGTYTEIEPPTRLAFTWIWDGDTRRTLIELDFQETDGITELATWPGTEAVFTRDGGAEASPSGLWDEEAVRSLSTSRVGQMLRRNLERTLEPAPPKRLPHAFPGCTRPTPRSRGSRARTPELAHELRRRRPCHL